MSHPCNVPERLNGPIVRDPGQCTTSVTNCATHEIPNSLPSPPPPSPTRLPVDEESTGGDVDLIYQHPEKSGIDWFHI